MTGPLDGLKVIDATGPVGNYCGKLFADLGADVVLLEPPGGTELRSVPQFREGSADSLAFTYANTNKRSLVVDLASVDDRDLVRRLLAEADLLLETWAPGELARLGLAPESLWAVNPALVITSITPFGQTGPWSELAATDLICLALGGLLALTGYPDGPPIRPYGEQSAVMGSLYAAVASMMALTHADVSGQGQWVDVSVHECVTTALETAVQYYDLEGIVRGRPEGRYRHAGSGIYDCLDGYVYLFVGGVASNRFWGRLVDWLVEEGIAGAAALAEPPWPELSFLQTDAAKATFADLFGQLAATRTKTDLYHQAQGRGIPLCPVNNPADLVANRQLAARDYFVALPDGPLAGFLAPGAPYRLSETPWSLRTSAPALGEHSAEIRAGLAATAGGRR